MQYKICRGNLEGKECLQVLYSSVFISFLLLGKSLTKSNLGEERIYLACTSRLQLITEGSQSKNLKQKPHRITACWLSHTHPQLAVLYCPWSGNHNELDPLTSTNNKTIPYRHVTGQSE